MNQIEEALGKLKETQQKAIKVQVEFNERCLKFVSYVKAFLKLAGHDFLIIGDTRQGVKIYTEGKVEWYGITTSAILDGYEKDLLNQIQKETDRVISTYEKFN